MKKLLKIVGIAFLGFIVLVVVAALLAGDDQTDTAASRGSANTSGSATAPEPTPTAIVWVGTTADDILAAYEDNEIAAKQTFADRPLEIHGIAGRPDFAPFTEDRYHIPVRSSDMLVFVTLSCEIEVNAENDAWVVTISDGDTITVRGYIRNNMSFGSLELEECTPIP